MKQRAMWWIMLVLIFAMFFYGCNSEKKVESEAETEAVETVSATLPPVEDLDYCVVSTEFGELYFQEQWSEFIRTEQKREGDVLRVSFIANMNNQSYELFAVTIGGGTGGLVGQLTDAAGTARDVYIEVFELEPAAELTEGEQNRLYAMQEELNYVIENLK